MRLDSVGEVIATRTLALSGERGSTEVLVRLGKPLQLPAHTDYFCPYQIEGAGSGNVRHACGVDAFQALQLALFTLRIELEVLNRDLDGKLRWDCGKDAQDLGF